MKTPIFAGALLLALLSVISCTKTDTAVTEKPPATETAETAEGNITVQHTAAETKDSLNISEKKEKESSVKKEAEEKNEKD